MEYLLQKLIQHKKEHHVLKDEVGNIIRKEDNLLKISYDFTGNKVVTSSIDLPKSNVLKYNFGGGNWFVLRPSGTEPKLKIYFATVGKNKQDAMNRNNKLRNEIMQIVESI